MLGMTACESIRKKTCFGGFRNGGLGAVLLLIFAARAYAMPRQGMVEFQPSRDSLCVVGQGHISPIYVDAGDFAGVTRAANDLAQDMGRVSGRKSAVVHATDGL